MGCNSCGSVSAVTDASNVLINNFGPQFHGALTTLLRALDKVEIRQRDEAVNVTWKPSNFPTKYTPYGQKPRGTEVVVKNTPLYFEENDPFVYDLTTPGPDGGICDGESLCSEPPANKVPGDTWQNFTYSFKGTAWETPVICLRDLLHYENGVERLRNFLTRTEKIPFEFYDNYIRNHIWETGEKYFLASTDLGLLWNSPDRVSSRQAPNIIDFRDRSPAGADADVATPKIVAIEYLKYILNNFMGADITPFNVNGSPNLMLVGVEADVFSIAYNDGDFTPTASVQGGMGFNAFGFNVVGKLPFAVKYDDMWFRGDFDANGNFYRIPSHVYVQQNGGLDLRVNPEWLTAKYGVLTFMTQRPFYYRRFAQLPAFPGKVPAESIRYLSPRFQWAPQMEKCSYTRGLVAWRAEDEFAFQPTGEKIIHVIFRRDELSSYLRAAKVGDCVEVVEDCRVPIPTTCSVPQVEGCCVAPGEVIGEVDYRDTAYTVTYTPGLFDYMGWDPEDLDTGIEAVFKTAKGDFDVLVVSANSTGTLLTFYVDPDQHKGGHFCCKDQLIGFVLDSAPAGVKCQALLDGGLRPDPFENTYYVGQLSAKLNTNVGDNVTVFFDNGCGSVDLIEMEVISLDNGTKRITLEATPADFPNGVKCKQAVKVCANNTNGCEDCIADAPAACEGSDVTPIDLDSDEGSV